MPEPTVCTVGRRDSALLGAVSTAGLEADRIAGGREPGDGSPQKAVAEQIEVSLALANKQ